MKFIIFLFMFSTVSFGVTINDSLLKVHAVLIPKISLMDFKIKQKIDNNTMIIDILYDKADYQSAVYLKDKIDAKYKNGIKKYAIETKLVLYSKISNESVNVYYLFPTNKQNIKKVIAKANMNKALTFSYLNNDLKYGVMISLIIESRVKPLINLEAIKSNDISLRPVLLDISSIYLNQAGDKIINILNRGSINKYCNDVLT